jgi:hypothetical protein
VRRMCSRVSITPLHAAIEDVHQAIAPVDAAIGDVDPAIAPLDAAIEDVQPTIAPLDAAIEDIHRDQPSQATLAAPRPATARPVPVAWMPAALVSTAGAVGSLTVECRVAAGWGPSVPTILGRTFSHFSLAAQRQSLGSAFLNRRHACSPKPLRKRWASNRTATPGDCRGVLRASGPGLRYVLSRSEG